MAYTLIADFEYCCTAFDVVGKYIAEDETEYWISASYDSAWETGASEELTPEVKDCYIYDEYEEIVGYGYMNPNVESIKITFDRENEQEVLIAATLKEGYHSFVVGTDTQIADNNLTNGFCDSCPLKAIFDKGELSAIQMVGASSLADATNNSPAFVFTPVTPATHYWLGNYGDRSAYGFAEFDEEAWNEEKAEFDEEKELILEYLQEALTYYKSEEGYEALKTEYREDYEWENGEITDEAAFEAEFNAMHEEEIAEIEEEIEFYESYEMIKPVLDSNGNVVEVSGDDSGMTVSWTGLESGATVEFKYSMGSVADTGATIGYNVVVDGGYVNPMVAEEGDTVTITAEAAPAGKKFKNWEVVSGGVTLADAKAKTTTFIMPANDVEIKAVYEDGTEEPDINTEAETGDTLIVEGSVSGIESVYETIVTEDNKGYTAADKAIVEAGGSALIYLEAKPIEGTTEGLTAISNKAKEDGYTRGSFLDISVFKQITPAGEEPGEPLRLIELPSHISVVIDIPEDEQGMQNYVVYRYHEGGVDVIASTKNADGEYIEVSEDGKQITLHIKKFSEYAIGYTTAAQEQIPNKGDNTLLYVMALVGGCVVVAYTGKKRFTV